MDKGIIGSMCSSLKEEFYEQFEWKIESFPSLVDTSTSTCFYTSPRFSFNDNTWYIQLYPCMTKERYCALFLTRTNVAAPISTHFTFGVKKDDGSVEQCFSSSFLFDSNRRWGSKGAIDQSDFLKRKSELVPSDCLNLIIIMSTRIPQLTKYVLDQSFQQLETVDDEKTSGMTGSQKVLSDIRKLFVTGDKSDVVICVQDTEFKAHSLILSARIPVLSAMFEHETQEKASNRINITDCEPTVFKAFLFYIYTGTIQNSTADNIYGLYRIADKYLVNDLKLLCRKHIQDHLKVETFCDTIELAQRYEDKDIYQHAIDYFAIHFRLIIRRVEWLRYLQENTTEANEILIKSFGSP